MRRHRLYLLIACLAAAWAAVQAQLLLRLPSDLMPQAGSDGDFLSVLLGDARKDLSWAMIHEADSYFHGGVDMECHHLHDAGREGAHCAHDHGDGHPEDAHEHEYHEETSIDPWRWINEHVRAPEIERHLEGAKAVEMMPWLWAAVKSDPHNEEAWSTAWYAASHLMKDKHLALKIAEEGWRLNPSSMEIACAVGRACRDKETFDGERSERMFGLALDMGLGKEKMTDREQFSFAEALSYLADGAQKRKDRNALASLLEKAMLKIPGHPIVKSIKHSIDSL